MTISSTVNRISYTGDGSTTAFSFPYLFYANDDLTVIIVTTATGAETVKTLTTHYTVAGAGVGAGGTVTMLTAPTNAQKLVILREVDYDQQDFDPVDNDPFPAASIEQAVDYAVMMAQQVKEITDRSLRFPRGDNTALTSEIPAAVTRASKALIFDASGNATVSTDDYEDQATAAAASAAAASASASAASTSASTASTQASNASTSATNAATAETNAETAETNAEAAQTAAEAARDLAQGYATAADVAKIEWQGAWLTSTVYAVNDAVSNGGSSYICIVAHTSGTFATDLAALKWEVLAAKGTDGAGSGDLLAANNLSDLASAATARTNLGLGTGALLVTDTDGTLAANSDSNVATQKAVKTYVDAAAGGSTTFKNLLINGAMSINQRAAASNADDTYSFDRWNILTQTGTVAVTQVAAAENTTPYMLRITQSQASAQRFGVEQIVESVNSTPYRGRAMALSARVRCSASTTLRYAILEWTGSADAATSDVVNDWTSATYTAGNFFLAANLTVTATGSTALTANTLTTITALTGTLGSSVNNLVVLFWTDSTQAQNVTLDVSKVQLEAGSAASTFEALPEDVVLARCKRYYQTANGPEVLGLWLSSSSVVCNWIHSPSMRAAPSITLATTTPTFVEPSVASRTGSGSTITASTAQTSGSNLQIGGFSSATAGHFAYLYNPGVITLNASAEL